MLAHRIGQAAGFGAEDKTIARLEAHGADQPTAARGESEQALGARLQRLHQRVPTGVRLQRGVFVIVEPGAAELFVIQRKTQRFNQVQGAAGIGAQADDVAGVGRNFGLDKNDVEHGSQGGRSTEDQGVESRGVRKAMATQTDAAPWRSSTRVASCSVAPEVITSSTSSRVWPSQRVSQA